MEYRISAAELARKLGTEQSVSTVQKALAAWRAAGEPDPAFADDLERINAADSPPEEVRGPDGLFPPRRQTRVSGAKGSTVSTFARRRRGVT